MGAKMSAAQKEAALKKQNLNKVNKKKSPAQDREDEDDGNFGELLLTVIVVVFSLGLR